MIPDQPFMDQDENEPQSWNLYSYVRNNPLKLVDPSGTSADEPSFWEKLGNLWSYGYFVGNEEIKKMEQERREWLTQNIFWKDKDGNWHPIDVTNFTTQDVFDVYREMKRLNESGELTQLSDSEASTARGQDPLSIAPQIIAPGSTKNIKKPVNLPSAKKVKVDMEHVKSGHMEGGSRLTQSGKKTVFPSNWTEKQVERAILNAYKNGQKLQSQGERVLVRGKSNGVTIEMWVNKTTKIIETAYTVSR
jgi:hypothetical protein